MHRGGAVEFRISIHSGFAVIRQRDNLLNARRIFIVESAAVVNQIIFWQKEQNEENKYNR